CNLFSPTMINQRLSEAAGVIGSRLLAGTARDLPARHQTLQAAIAWSFDLLTDVEQRLLARLAVFVGGFTLEAAAAVTLPAEAGDSRADDIVDGVASLVDKSLLRRIGQSADQDRFSMLATIREFALARLHERGEADELRRCHAVHFVALA